MAADQFSTALNTALIDARGNYPTRPVTVLCGPQARDDVITALASTGPRVGVSVQTSGFSEFDAFDSAARTPKKFGCSKLPPPTSNRPCSSRWKTS